jgi:hypothetical protein
MLNVLLEERKEEKFTTKPVKQGYDWRYENSISNGKKIDIDGDYSQWRTNNVLANHKDSIFYVNEMNINSTTDQMHYDYLHASLRKQKRWSKNESKEEKKYREQQEELHNLVSNYYKYNTLRTKEALRILTAEQIDIIRNKNNKGGVK